MLVKSRTIQEASTTDLTQDKNLKRRLAAFGQLAWWLLNQMNHFDGLFKELVKKLKAMKIDQTYPFTLDKTNYEKNRTGNATDSL